MVLSCYEFYFREMGADVHVLQKNHDLFIVRTGDTNDNVQISTMSKFLRVFCDVTVGGVCPWLVEGCLEINLLLILNFVPGGVEVID